MHLRVPSDARQPACGHIDGSYFFGWVGRGLPPCEGLFEGNVDGLRTHSDDAGTVSSHTRRIHCLLPRNLSLGHGLVPKGSILRRKLRPDGIPLVLSLQPQQGDTDHRQHHLQDVSRRTHPRLSVPCRARFVGGMELFSKCCCYCCYHRSRPHGGQGHASDARTLRQDCPPCVWKAISGNRFQNRVTPSRESYIVLVDRRNPISRSATTSNSKSIHSSSENCYYLCYCDCRNHRSNHTTTATTKKRHGAHSSVETFPCYAPKS
mmetsp:Transcript_1897/g.2135  ORF Transcript_1897/g.2135 Transcript_1897/m.2135 type:complete len:263 (+) Transcript_1897:574-1362(+)